MYLRLYKEPLVDTTDPRKIRLLFEVQPGGCVFGGREVDFYLYVWVRDCEFVEAFQAVVDNDYVMSYDAPARLMVGRISQGPVNRTIMECQDAEAIKLCQSVMVNLENYQFPALLKKVTAIACGMDAESRLTETESFRCRDLTRQTSGGRSARPESPRPEY
jgi:hypothetical protein